MKRLKFCAALSLAAALSACSSLRGVPRGAAQPDTTPRHATTQGTAPPADAAEPPPDESQAGVPQPGVPQPTAASPTDANAGMPPCMADDSKSKAKTKAKPKRVRREAPPPQPAPPAVAEAPPDEIVDARVATLPVPVMSILGKRVQSPKGDDLGRVVDVLADAGGRVRIAIIDFGGFLGVGDRRIAVDWPLLRFNPDARNPPLLLSLSLEKLKAAPEYKDNPRPQTLMEPAPAAPPADAKK